MALINCPECGKEISDRAGKCPHCGCPIGEDTSQKAKEKKPKNKKVIIAISCAIVVLIAAGLTVYTLVIRPATLYNRAVKEYERGNSQEAIEILQKTSSNKKAQALLNEIVYNEALVAVNEENFEGARNLLKSIPEYSETSMLLAEIEKAEKYNEAMRLLEQGKYEEHSCNS